MTPITVRCSACGFVASAHTLAAAAANYTDHSSAVHPFNTPRASTSTDALRKLVSLVQTR